MLLASTHTQCRGIIGGTFERLTAGCVWPTPQATVNGVSSLSPIGVHYTLTGVMCDVNIYADSDMRISDANRIARAAREQILADVWDVVDVDVHLELDSRRDDFEVRPELDSNHPDPLPFRQ